MSLSQRWLGARRNEGRSRFFTNRWPSTQCGWKVCIEMITPQSRAAKRSPRSIKTTCHSAEGQRCGWQKHFFKKKDENEMQHGNVHVNITTSTKSTWIKRHVVLHSSLMYSNMFVYTSPLVQTIKCNKVYSIIFYHYENISILNIISYHATI